MKAEVQSTGSFLKTRGPNTTAKLIRTTCIVSLQKIKKNHLLNEFYINNDIILSNTVIRNVFNELYRMFLVILCNLNGHNCSISVNKFFL